IIIAIGPELLLIAGGFVALYAVFKVLNNVIDPILNFLGDLGDLVKEISAGDAKGAFAELRELFGDLNDIADGITNGVFDAIIEVLGVIERLTGVNTTPVINVLDKLKALATGDSGPF